MGLRSFAHLRRSPAGRARASARLRGDRGRVRAHHARPAYSSIRDARRRRRRGGRTGRRLAVGATVACCRLAGRRGDARLRGVCGADRAVGIGDVRGVPHARRYVDAVRHDGPDARARPHAGRSRSVDVRGDARDEPDGRLPDGVAAAARDRRPARRRGRRLGVPAVPRSDRSAARAGALARAVVRRPDALVAARRGGGRGTAGAPLRLRHVDRREGVDRGAARCAGGDVSPSNGARISASVPGSRSQLPQRRRSGRSASAARSGSSRSESGCSSRHGRRSARALSPRPRPCSSCLRCPPSPRQLASSATGISARGATRAGSRTCSGRSTRFSPSGSGPPETSACGRTATGRRSSSSPSLRC